MDYKKGMYTFIKEGHYQVGCNKARVHEISSSSLFLESGLKKSFLLASVPEHSVYVENLSISDKFVSAEEFEFFVESSGYVTEAETDGWGWTWDNGWKKVKDISWLNPTGTILDDFYQKNKALFPVLQVSNNDAVSYCKWCSLQKRQQVSLPREYEWEIFANMNTIAKIPAEESLPGDLQCLENYFEKIWETIGSTGKNYPIGMIWEWTDSWYEAYPGGEGNREFGIVYKVLKGGSFFSNAVQRMNQYRFRRCPTARSPFYGFRVAVRNNG